MVSSLEKIDDDLDKNGVTLVKLAADNPDNDMERLQIDELPAIVFYDNKFLYNLNGGSTSAAETRITSIFTHVSTIFSKLTVSGVSGAIVPTVVSKTHKSQWWRASQHLS